MEHGPFIDDLPMKHGDTLRQTNIAIENGPFIVDFPIENGASFHSFLYVYQRVYVTVLQGIDRTGSDGFTGSTIEQAGRTHPTMNSSGWFWEFIRRK